MGLFNELVAEAECPKCDVAGLFRIQFKFGTTWQHVYKIGDILEWGAPDEGIPNCRRVAVESVAPDCKACGAEHLEFEIMIEKGVIVSVTPVREQREYFGQWILLER